jgi:hypothetical protein
MATGMNEFQNHIRNLLDKPGDFRPEPYYDAEADTLFFYARDVQSFAKRLNPILTLFLSAEDESLVGCKLKGVQRILECLKRLDLKIHDDEIDLTILLNLALVTPPEDPDLQERLEQNLRDYQGVKLPRRELEPA